MPGLRYYYLYVFTLHRHLRYTYAGGCISDTWEWHPAPALRPYILCYWVSTSHGQALPPTTYHVLPDGCVDWLLQPDGASTQQGGIIAGMMTRPLILRSSGIHSTIAVRFRPGGAHAFLGEAMASLAERVAPADELLGNSATRLEDRLAQTTSWPLRLRMLEQDMLARLERIQEIDPLIPAALRQWISGADADKAFLRKVGVGDRQFRRICDRSIGVGPARLKRVLRFMRATDAIHHTTASLAHIAISAGYSDQSHMTHEFQQLAGLSPTHFLPNRPAGCPLFTIQSPAHLVL